MYIPSLTYTHHQISTVSLANERDCGYLTMISKYWHRHRHISLLIFQLINSIYPWVKFSVDINSIYPCVKFSVDLCLELFFPNHFFRDFPFLAFGGFPCGGVSVGMSPGRNSPCVLLIPLSRLTAFRSVLNLLFAAARKLLILLEREILDPLSSLLLDKLVVLLLSRRR